MACILGTKPSSCRASGRLEIYDSLDLAVILLLQCHRFAFEACFVRALPLVKGAGHGVVSETEHNHRWAGYADAGV
jgi:hypothetical protein